MSAAHIYKPLAACRDLFFAREPVVGDRQTCVMFVFLCERWPHATTTAWRP